MTKQVKQLPLHTLWKVLALDVGSQTEENNSTGGPIEQLLKILKNSNVYIIKDEQRDDEGSHVIDCLTLSSAAYIVNDKKIR